ncbi:MAG: TIGR03000 domain-containing protein [Gemmataceae bacterium]
MLRFSLVAALVTTTAFAGSYPRYVGPYGAYTGGHGYSYATAYNYGFAWSAADTWKRDIFAYPGGISPYRPYGRPISKTVFPRPDTPYIAVPGADGLPTLVKPTPSLETVAPGEVIVNPAPAGALGPVGTPLLQPVPAATATAPAPVASALAPAAAPAAAGTIKVVLPESAELWIEKEKMPQTGAERVFQTLPLPAGKMQVLSVRAKWIDQGREVEQYRVVGVKPGETARLVFGATQP